MIQFEKIKLIVWDLDETFWHGTLSEEGVVLDPFMPDLMKQLADAGIVNSICSKNDREQVVEKLKELNLLDYFVFMSIDWTSKGERVKNLIQAMQLRSPNVLFIDDNHSNREEVRYCCPSIMVEGPEIIEKLYEYACSAPKKDLQHNRLKQYRVLEEKHEEKTHYATNEEFLFESHIQLKIETDCQSNIDRIHDLVLRANQLNFTKKRSSIEELETLLAQAEYRVGYVTVSDKFGDYGIVGFFALKENVLEHFVFSCRTLGMGIEQYVYNYLERPSLEIVGEVISDLTSEEIPAWINQTDDGQKTQQATIRGLKEHMVLIKGPCDLFQIYPYIAQTELFDTEFTYVTDSGGTIESTGHTTHVVEAMRLSAEQKERVLREVPFADAGQYDPQIFQNSYKVVVLSILADANLGVYQRKETGERIAFMEYLKPLTDPQNWDDMVSGKIDTRGHKLSREQLEAFADRYEFVGRNGPEQVVDNLRYIREHLPKDCLLVVMLGGELYYEKNTFPAYNDRHIVHQKINSAVRQLTKETQGFYLLDVNRYLKDQSSFYDHFNHYIKPIYYAIAQELVAVINDHTGSTIKEKAKWKMLQIRIKEVLASILQKLKK